MRDVTFIDCDVRGFAASIGTNGAVSVVGQLHSHKIAFYVCCSLGKGAEETEIEKAVK